MRQCPEAFANKRLVALDLETTGLNSKFNNIIEVGVVEVKDRIQTTSYSKLFGGGFSSMHLILSVHKIKDVERKNLPTFSQCASRLANWLEDAILVTHNGIKFDVPFMQAKMAETDVSLKLSGHIDTYQAAKKLGLEKHSLEWLSNHYGIEYNESNHRGVTDCLCTFQLLYAMVEEFGIDAVLKV